MRRQHVADSRLPNRWKFMESRILVMIIVVSACFSGALPDIVVAEDKKPDQPHFLDEARKYVIESTKDGRTLMLNEKSLLNWTNPVRDQARGALYVWSLDGRPLAIGSLFTYEHAGAVHPKHEFHSLTNKPLRSTFDGKLAWNPSTPGIEWHDFPDSPEPVKSHIGRLLQMRQLSRPFRAELVSPTEERTQLRLVSRPLLEYSSPTNDIIDGSIFSYTVATDPEVLLLIEAYEDAPTARRGVFRYAFARFHYWEVGVFDGDKKLWSAPLDMSHERNAIGNAENLSKIYNSYRPDQ